MASRILVVENEEDVQRFIADVLKGAGYRVTAPADSYVALELALDDPYGLITLDPWMPLLNGEAFARTLRAYHVQTPILLVTDSINDRQWEVFQGLGVAGMIAKPFQVNRLLQSVKKHLPLSTE